MKETPEQYADLSPKKQENSGFSSQLLGFAVLVGAWLYFTGWTYRWTYFAFFQLEVTTLDLPIESYYIGAMQAFFLSPLAILRASVAFILTAIFIAVMLWVFNNNLIGNFIRNRRQKTLQFLYKQARIHRQIWLSQLLNSVTIFESDAWKVFEFWRSLVNEIAVALVIFTVTFWLAHWQAQSDAWKDAVNATSTLPVVTIVAPEDRIPIGRLPNDLSNNPSGFRVIGDRERYLNLMGRETNESSDRDHQRVWRLLIARGSYFYIFPALAQKEGNLSPPILMIHESESSEHLIILSPTDFP